MKSLTLTVFSFLYLLTFYPGKVTAQSNSADKQVIATFEEGENFMYGESCFTLTSNKTGSYFITRKDKNFFIYDNGVRKGPFTTLKEDMLKTCTTPLNPLCAKFYFGDCQVDAYNKFVITEDAGMKIKMKDKTLGPYMAVMQFAVTCDETKFAALVMNPDQSLHFIHSSGKDIPINGTPQWLLLSADGDQALAAFGKTLDPSKIDMKNFNLAEFTAFKVIDLNGNISGPYDPDKESSSNFWFCKTAGSHWFLISGEKILRDGKEYRNELTGYNSCDMWISEDGKRIACVDYGQEGVKETSDFWLIKNPLDITTYLEGGKRWLKWISLENGNSVVVYKKVL